MYSKIYSALVQHYVSGGFGLPTGYENDGFEPNTGTPYATVYNLPADSHQDTVGDIGWDEWEGIFQVSIFYPVGKGRGDALTLADQILTHFKAGSTPEYSGQIVTIQSSTISPGRVEGGWYQLDISVAWAASTLR
ncbi:phage tail terminator-like protein [Microbulbifer sp. ZKSA004]|uniref:phage tail terminator-like protein n=1 Tax=unclassified Microbulbifer TaxID=2619833 RepID=UPI004039B857